jgi:hypothetical protein
MNRKLVLLLSLFCLYLSHVSQLVQSYVDEGMLELDVSLHESWVGLHQKQH